MLNPESGGSGGSNDAGGGVSSSVPDVGGNRWPKPETLALLRIRSDMDAAFRDSNLKGPLWDQISRKMAELGFSRSAKKCREKFENVYKYHKRTKDCRTSKPDGKTYRFFDQLKALETNASLAPPPPHLPPPTATVAPQPSVTNVPMPSHVSIPSTITPTNLATPQPANNIPTNSFPSNQASQQPPIIIPLPQTQTTLQPPRHNPHMSTGMLSNSTSSSSTSSDEDLQMRHGKKRKWKEFFEKLMNEVVQKQEDLQNKFLDTLEKRERDRISREEAWKLQEMAKMNRAHELLVKERSMASARDAAIIAFLQQVSEQHNLPNPSSNTTNKVASPPPPPLQVATQAKQPPPPPPPQSTTQLELTISPPQVALPTPTNTMIVPVNDNANMNVSTSSSRWPKEEIEALINIRTSLEFKYQDNGPKGPLWEEISLAMGKLGYNRNSKRCKEKWENINKYYKKVKESNKKRPEDSKTCPYFHTLEAIYNEKAKSSSNKPENQIAIMAQPEQQWPPQRHQDSTMQVQDLESDNNNDNDEEEEYEAERYEIVKKKQQAMCSATNAVE